MRTLLQNVLLHGKLCLCSAAVAFAVVPCLAQEKQLALNGYRWETETMTYWISVAKDVAPEAAAEVQTAIEDWQTALASVPGAPSLQVASSSRIADLILDLRSAETRRIRGGPATPLGGGAWFKRSGKPNSPSCILDSAGIEIRGSRLGSPPADAAIRNLAKHLIGHALGLDHVTCGGSALCGTMDVMDIGHSLFIPTENLPISDCDLLGLAAIYSAPSCEQIPASVPYLCEQNSVSAAAAVEAFAHIESVTVRILTRPSLGPRHKTEQKYAEATVVIVDDSGAAVPGATVKGSFTGNLLRRPQTVSGTTDLDGKVTLALSKSVGWDGSSPLSFTFCVDDVDSSPSWDGVEICDTESY